MALKVSFVDTSVAGPSGPIQGWHWDFGDGGTSTSQDPVHTYSAAGSYSVTLTVTGSGSDGTDSVTHTETVTADTLNAGFSTSATGLTVTLTDTSTAGPSGPITAWDVDWGDGSSHATGSGPWSHTYASAGTFTVVLTVTGTSPDGTAAITKSVVAAAPPSGTVYFDGRAARMTALSSTGRPPRPPSGTLVQTQTPALWTALLFEDNDIQLVTDATYGKAFKCTVPIGDSNPWNTGAPSQNGAGELSLRKPNELGLTRYYSIAARVDSWTNVTDITFATFLSVGYQTSQGDQVGLGWINHNGALYWQVHQNSGFEDYPNTIAQPAVSYKTPLMAVTYGQWREFVVAVKWATDNTGLVQVYSRVPSGTWSKVFERLNTPTEIYGTTTYGSFAADGSNWQNVLDKIGLYYSLGGVIKTETCYLSGLTRCSDLDTAKAVFPA